MTPEQEAYNKRHDACQRAYERMHADFELEWDCEVCDQNVTLNEPYPGDDIIGPPQRALTVEEVAAIVREHITADVMRQIYNR